MYEGEDVNTIDLLYEAPTDKENGVKVIVPVNSYDRTDFVNKIKEQLAYFQNVYFNVDGISNDFSIFRSENFQWSPLSNDNKLHICLDDVYYPIDFGKLGIDSINFPIALRFGLTDGIFPTPNRESIRYTKDAKENIIKKLRMVADYFVEKYNESVTDTDDFTKIIEFYEKDALNISLLKKQLNVKLLLQYSTLQVKEPKMKNINVLNLQKLYHNRMYFLNEYEVKHRLENNKFKSNDRGYYTVKIDHIMEGDVLVYSDRISGHMKDYLKQHYPTPKWKDRKFIMKKVRPFTLGAYAKDRINKDYQTYYDLLNLKYVPRNEWRTAIKEFQSIMAPIMKNIINIDEIQIPKPWLDARKKVKINVNNGSGGRRIKLKGELSGKQVSALEREVANKYGKLVPTIYNLENMINNPFLSIYGGQNDAGTLDKLFSVVDDCKVKLVVFSDRELKNMEKVEYHNWMPISKFMKGDNKPFKRLVTAYLINNLYMTHRSAFNKIDELNQVSTDLADKVRKLDAYRDVHFKNGNSTIYEAMLEVAEANNAFDGEIYPIYREVKAILDKFTFINTMCKVMSGWGDNSGIINVLKDLFKYNKQRVNLGHYKLVLNEEPKSEEVLTDESVEELTEND